MINEGNNEVSLERIQRLGNWQPRDFSQYSYNNDNVLRVLGGQKGNPQDGVLDV